MTYSIDGRAFLMISKAYSGPTFWVYMRYAAMMVALRPVRKKLSKLRSGTKKKWEMKRTHSRLTMHQNPSALVQLCLYECYWWKEMSQDIRIFRVIQQNLVPNECLQSDCKTLYHNQKLNTQHLVDSNSSAHCWKYTVNIVGLEVLDIQSAWKIAYPEPGNDFVHDCGMLKGLGNTMSDVGCVPEPWLTSFESWYGCV